MVMKIRYYSTNRNLDSVTGVVPFKETVSFREALLQGQAPDEGLFMPDPIPTLDLDDILVLKGMVVRRCCHACFAGFSRGRGVR